MTVQQRKNLATARLTVTSDSWRHPPERSWIRLSARIELASKTRPAARAAPRSVELRACPPRLVLTRVSRILRSRRSHLW